jgi:hypothetical protein
MMKKPPNVRSQNPELGNFDDEFADLQEILYRSARSERSEPRDLDDVDRAEPSPRPESSRYLQPNRYPESRRHPEADPHPEETRRSAADRQAAPGRHADRYHTEDDDEDLDYEDDDENDSVPAFLSDEAYDQEYPENWLLRRKSSLSLRILVGVLMAAGAAVLFALVTSDTTRAVIANAKSSFGGALADQPAQSQADPGQLTLGDMQLKDPTRLSTPPPIPPVRGLGNGGFSTAAIAPPRDDITNAYSQTPQTLQTLQTRPPPPDEPPMIAAPVRRLDRDELATLMRRARGLLAAGDIPSARLLLERAANAQDANAAFMLGQTYDPQMLGTQDTRKIKSDPATARAWYQQAAQLGSAEAQRRLGQLRN